MIGSSKSTSDSNKIMTKYLFDVAIQNVALCHYYFITYQQNPCTEITLKFRIQSTVFATSSLSF